MNDSGGWSAIGALVQGHVRHVRSYTVVQRQSQPSVRTSPGSSSDKPGLLTEIERNVRLVKVMQRFRYLSSTVRAIFWFLIGIKF